jgi:hypothetical protein
MSKNIKLFFGFFLERNLRLHCIVDYGAKTPTLSLGKRVGNVGVGHTTQIVPNLVLKGKVGDTFAKSQLLDLLSQVKHSIPP